MPLDEQLYHIFDSRIRNIPESAIEHEAEALVLGAFGCGAFHNPPEIVSKAFRNILLEDRYRHAFDHVVFAVKRTGSFCENIECFEIEFSRFLREQSSVLKEIKEDSLNSKICLCLDTPLFNL